jgi:hypothetical protein
MHVKLIIRMNHAERLSIRMGISPKKPDPPSKNSNGWPARECMAGMEVKTAFNIIKALLMPGLKRDGETKIISKPISEIPTDIANNCKSSIFLCSASSF